VLNVGCGDDSYGTHRLDFVRGRHVTELGSALQLPYRDGSFDEVFAANILEHMPNPLLFLQECKRVLRRGGRLVVITDHAAFLGYHVHGVTPGDYHQWHGAGGDRHFMLFTTGHLQNLVEAAGLRAERVATYTKWKQGLAGRMLGRIAPRLAHANLRVEAVRVD
jgi:ubiquinone/menaquinone biosynthesis C-methylase UbiE